MPQPTPSDVHVNRPLTNIAVAYMQDQAEFIADKVFPNVPVMKQSDRYFQFPKDNWFRTEARERGLSQESVGSGFEVDSTPNYFAKVFALHKDIDDQLRANVDEPLNIDEAATQFVTRGMLLRREKDWASKYFTSGIWTGSTTGTDITPSTLWSATGATPIKDIREQMASVKEKTGVRPNRLVLSEDVWTIIQDTADFVDRIALDQRKIVTTELLAAVLGMPPEGVLIGGAVQNVAIEGATADMQFLFKKCALLAYAAERPSIMLPSAGYTFSWTGYTGAGEQGFRILRYRADLIRSDRVEGEMAYDQKLVASDLGAFFLNAIA